MASSKRCGRHRLEKQSERRNARRLGVVATMVVAGGVLGAGHALAADEPPLYTQTTEGALGDGKPAIPQLNDALTYGQGAVGAAGLALTPGFPAAAPISGGVAAGMGVVQGMNTFAQPPQEGQGWADGLMEASWGGFGVG